MAARARLQALHDAGGGAEHPHQEVQDADRLLRRAGLLHRHGGQLLNTVMCHVQYSDVKIHAAC